MLLIDSHCHFDDDSFHQDHDQAYRRALAAGVEIQVIPGVTADWWPRIKRTCERYTGLYAAYGLHPLYLDEHREPHLEQLREWIERERPVAVGECGLDYYIEQADPEQQRFYFTAQVALAREYGLPVIIHARRSVEEVIHTLRRYPGLRGVLHSYSGSEEQARQLIKLGFRMSFGGPVTYERAKRLHRLIQALPLESILLETDAPDQPVSSHRGERNEPAYLPIVLEAVSRLRGQPAELIAEQTTQNCRELFGLP